MGAIASLAAKDLRLLARDRLGMFFIFIFPLLYGVFFGAIAGPRERPSGPMKIAVIDDDRSDISARFVRNLTKDGSVKVVTRPREQAVSEVRKAELAAYLVLPKGFGNSAGILWAASPELELGIDPTRKAESGMLQGLVLQAMAGLIRDRFADPAGMRRQLAQSRSEIASTEDIPAAQRAVLAGFLSAVDLFLARVDPKVMSDGPSMEPAKVKTIEVTATPGGFRGLLRRIRSPYEISFPSAIVWGVMGCAAGFAVSIVQEKTIGTMMRLKVAPISRVHILAGKALACAAAICAVITLMLVLGRLAFGIRLDRPFMLAAAIAATVACYVGLMMLLSVLGRTEQAVGSASWAILVVMAMIGGGMVPLIFLPQFVQTVGHVSPVKWSILALEGAIWRGFTPGEMLRPCLVLAGIGLTAFFSGAAILKRREI